jgi:hypothetical protein
MDSDSVKSWSPHRDKGTPFGDVFAQSAPSLARRVNTPGDPFARDRLRAGANIARLQFAAATAEQLRREQASLRGKAASETWGLQRLGTSPPDGVRGEQPHNPYELATPPSLLVTPHSMRLGRSSPSSNRSRGPGSQIAPPTGSFAGDERRRPFGRTAPNGMSTAQYAWGFWKIEEGEFRPSPKERLWTASYAGGV